MVVTGLPPRSPYVSRPTDTLDLHGEGGVNLLTIISESNIEPNLIGRGEIQIPDFPACGSGLLDLEGVDFAAHVQCSNYCGKPGSFR